MIARLLPPPLATRSAGPELMDDLDGIGGAELAVTLRELEQINRWLGGHGTTRRALDLLAARVDLDTRRPLRALDVGGGSGDAVPVIIDWATRRGLSLEVVTVDLHPETTRAAAERLANVAVARAICGDAFAYEDASFDIVHASLFLHHFDGDDAARALSEMRRIARLGVVLNDLRREALPWLLVRALTAGFSQNRLIRADAPHSVARGFRRADWDALGPAAGLELTLQRTWAFRWAIAGVCT